MRIKSETINVAPDEMMKKLSLQSYVKKPERSEKVPQPKSGTLQQTRPSACPSDGSCDGHCWKYAGNATTCQKEKMSRCECGDSDVWCPGEDEAHTDEPLCSQQEQEPGCYYKSTKPKRLSCRGEKTTWTIDWWGKKYRKSDQSSEVCLKRESEWDKYCGTTSQWKYIEGSWIVDDDKQSKHQQQEPPNLQPG